MENASQEGHVILVRKMHEAVNIKLSCRPTESFMLLHSDKCMQEVENKNTNTAIDVNLASVLVNNIW